MYQLTKTWRNKVPFNQTVNSRTWNRRIQWLEDGSGTVKLKLETPEGYREVGVLEGLAQKVWDRFKDGQSIEDSVSILGTELPPEKLSRKA